ncbi:MAG: heavy-metal-associated domain-containing protein [Saprospiraceae bacterium]|nr:heavy-metal-associated domain-containing protein [Candidatus Opimibacter skivensis]
MYKQLILITSVFGVMILTGSCAPDSGAKGGNELAVKTDISCDHCKECDSCEPKIINALKATPGVKSASLKLENETILVNFDPSKIDADKIRQVIASTGFDADNVKATPEGYDGLEDCCKKKM